MDIDQEYLEYAGQSSLALLAISAAYFLRPGNPVSYGALLLIPLLYGYTAYISRESFRPATILSLVTLIFVPLGTLMGFIAVFLPISNILISVFAGGTGFKNYSNSTLLPMLFTGLILGGIVFGAAQTQPEIRQGIVDGFETTSAEYTSLIIEQSQLNQLQQEASRDIVEGTAENTIVLTRVYINNRTELDREAQQDIDSAFTKAQQELPSRLGERTVEQNSSLDISQQASQATANIIEANLGILILLMALSFYMINPLVSILTGLSALAFEKLNQRL